MQSSFAIPDLESGKFKTEMAEMLQMLWRLLTRKLMNIIKGRCQVLPVHTEPSMIYKTIEAPESSRTLQNSNKNLHINVHGEGL